MPNTVEALKAVELLNSLKFACNICRVKVATGGTQWEQLCRDCQKPQVKYEPIKQPGLAWYLSRVAGGLLSDPCWPEAMADASNAER